MTLSSSKPPNYMSESESYSDNGEIEIEQIDEKTYFNRKPKDDLQFDQANSKLFGTVQKIVKCNVLIKPLDEFGVVYSAILKVNNVLGEIFDMIGPQYDPLYVARFQTGDLNEKDEVYVDSHSIVLYDKFL